ncbi:unnamed protein product [Caenorhabditis angaria]|uniref:G-protein coupled receptors family 1 profile domain-containing protein n=1 Tax=Caenorhabditis angaria TaxID=860376 RepID=A0A9P1IJV0_9PELO|nr:unnamed protein product [Caenorhabditis angaria]
MNFTEELGILEEEDEFYELSTLELIIWCLLYAIIAAMAIIGNSMVLYITIFRIRVKSITTYFILNLGFADLFTGIFAIPFKFQAALFQEWYLPSCLCHIVPYVETVALTVSVFTLVTSAVHEFRTIFFAKYAQMSEKSAKIWVLLIWFMSITVSIPHGLFHSVHEFENGTVVQCLPVYAEENWWKIYNVYLTIIQYFVPMIILDTAYTMIAVKIWTMSRRIDVDTSNQKLMRVLIIVVACFSLCWFPLETYLLLNEVKPEINEWKYINLLFFFSHWLAMSNSCLNPIIYYVYNEKYSEEYRRIFAKICYFATIRPKVKKIERRWNEKLDKEPETTEQHVPLNGVL